MQGEETLIGTLPSAFGFFGDVLFRWVPASIIAASETISGDQSPYYLLTGPVSPGGVVELLKQTSSAGTYEGLVQGWYTFTLISLLASIPFFALIVYCLLRIVQIRRMERKKLLAAQRTVASKDVSRTQLRWRRVLEQSAASAPEAWRLAILEADIMLNELLDLQGYRGETMADKMKRVDRAQFNSIDDAWEAHRVRNRIAHEGSSHEMNPREVRRVISLYERVFKEFKFIE